MRWPVTPPRSGYPSTPGTMSPNVKSRDAKDGDFTQLMDNMKAFVTTGTRCGLGVSFITGKDNDHRLYEVCS
jgi:hypothetical protein